MYAHHFLSALNNELELYREYSIWMNHILNVYNTVINIDAAPREEPNLDIQKVAEYLEKHLGTSILNPFFECPEGDKKKEFENGESVFKYFCEHQEYQKGKTRSCTWTDLISHISKMSTDIFQKPAEAMKNSIRAAKPIDIFRPGMPDVLEMHMKDIVSTAVGAQHPIS